MGDFQKVIEANPYRPDCRATVWSVSVAESKDIKNGPTNVVQSGMRVNDDLTGVIDGGSY